MPAWLVLMVSLPPHPSSVRVRVWRKLRALGAVALKKSAYILPFTPDNLERFQWLGQEVQKERGEATLLRVDQIENMAPADVIRRFQEARSQDYRALAARYRAIAQGLERRGRTPAPRRDEELARLAREVQRVREIDFFEAPGSAEITRLRETIEMRLHRPGGGDGAQSPIDLAALGAELGHQGEDCTFETIVKRGRLGDGRLAQLGEIVHEIDLRDGKFTRDEARGLDLAIRGLLAVVEDDRQVLAHGMTLFDGLYAVLEPRAT